MELIPGALTGLLLTASFPKTGAAPLAWVALVPLLLSIRGVAPGKSFRLGFGAGLVHFLSLLYWLVFTMNVYGNIPTPLAIAIFFLLSAYLGCYLGVFSMLVSRFCQSVWGSFFLIPVFWVFIEYARFFIFPGFPWELLGYSQYRVLPVIQIADTLGVYGVSFWIALANASVFSGVVFFVNNGFSPKNGRAKEGRHKKGPENKKVEKNGGKSPHDAFSSRMQVAAAAAVFLLLSGGLISYGKWRMASVERQMASGVWKNIAVVQGNIEQNTKWNPAFQDRIIEKYIDLSASVKKSSPDLFIWPETATPFYFFQEPSPTVKTIKGLRRVGGDFVIGTPRVGTRENGRVYFNSAFVVNGSGTVFGRYDKARLVPYGEYIPFKKFMPFIGKIVAQVGDFVPGEKGNTILWGDFRLGIQICYEIIFPDLSRAMAQNNAVLLVNITNDAWFGYQSAAYQHFSMATFRAVENRRSVVRAANTGISGFIDPTGRILEQTPLFTEAALAKKMPLLDKKTFYTRNGDVFAWICVGIALFFVLLKIVRQAINRWIIRGKRETIKKQ